MGPKRLDNCCAQCSYPAWRQVFKRDLESPMHLANTSWQKEPVYPLKHSLRWQSSRVCLLHTQGKRHTSTMRISGMKMLGPLYFLSCTSSCTEVFSLSRLSSLWAWSRHQMHTRGKRHTSTMHISGMKMLGRLYYFSCTSSCTEVCSLSRLSSCLSLRASSRQLMCRVMLHRCALRVFQMVNQELLPRPPWCSATQTLPCTAALPIRCHA